MSATVIVIDPAMSGPADLSTAVAWLLSGRVVAYPTDTFYGLAVDPRSDAAVRSLFDLKGRNARVAVPLLAASREQVEQCVGPLTGDSRQLADAFWPGPVSLVVDAPPSIAAGVHGGLGTVAIRVPAHAVARHLADGLGFPVTATSANPSGAPPASDVAQLGAIADDPRVLVIDGGVTPGGAPSTIVDGRHTPVILIRDGAIAWSRVLESLHG